MQQSVPYGEHNMRGMLVPFPVLVRVAADVSRLLSWAAEERSSHEQKNKQPGRGHTVDGRNPFAPL